MTDSQCGRVSLLTLVGVGVLVGIGVLVMVVLDDAREDVRTAAGGPGLGGIASNTVPVQTPPPTQDVLQLPLEDILQCDSADLINITETFHEAGARGLPTRDEALTAALGDITPQIVELEPTWIARNDDRDWRVMLRSADDASTVAAVDVDSVAIGGWRVETVVFCNSLLAEMSGS